MSIIYKLNASEFYGTDREDYLNVTLNLEKAQTVERFLSDPNVILQTGIVFSGVLTVNGEEKPIEFTFGVRNPLYTIAAIGHATAVGFCIATKIGVRLTSLVAKRIRKVRKEYSGEELISKIELLFFHMVDEFDSGEMSEEFGRGIGKELILCVFGAATPFVEPFFDNEDSS